MYEEWRDVIGYEGCYEVSNLGVVRSVTRVRPLISKSGKNTAKIFYGCTMKTKPNNKGYELVWFCKNSKRKACTVHRLVALAFIPNPLGLPEVNHKDGVKAHNYVENLEWSTVADNRKHAWATGLQPKKVLK